MQLAALLGVGAFVRAALILWGTWQDSNCVVKFTDIDYNVYSDAAQLMAQGTSPYQRSTYRYTPLLALALLPNIWLHSLWGKVLFSAADILAAWLIFSVLRKQGVRQQSRLVCTAVWLFNPFTATISARGNGEGLVAALLLGLLLALLSGHSNVAAALLGVAMHWRVYPVIYALPVLLFGRVSKVAFTSKAERHKGAPTWQRMLLSARWLEQAAVAGAVFAALGAACYAMYGHQFLQEAFLYHAQRKDPRHSFSSSYYATYLSYSPQGRAHLGSLASLPIVAQLVCVVAVGWWTAGDLPFCMLLQTLTFVTFNKVCTAQYFIWYMSLLPVALPSLLAGASKVRLAAAAGAWLAAQLHWLGWAYLLEFRGLPVHLGLWAAACAFQAANAWLTVQLLLARCPASGSGVAACGWQAQQPHGGLKQS